MRTKLNSFRVRNFRSILDSGWVDLSPDNLSTIIGQNGSGKTVVLNALKAYYDRNFIETDLPLDSSDCELYPIIECSFSVAELEKLLPEGYVPELYESILAIDNGRLKRLNIGVKVNKDFSVRKYIENEKFRNLVSKYESQELPVDDTPIPKAEEGSVDGVATPILSSDYGSFENELISNFEIICPKFVLYEDYLSDLPSHINLSSIGDNQIKGALGMQNLLLASGIDIEHLKEIHTDKTKMAILLEDAGIRISEEFNRFWRKYVKNDQLRIKIEIDSDHNIGEEAPGDPFLTVFIRNENKYKLSYSQRSNGLKWFLSFFLLMRAQGEFLRTENEKGIGNELLMLVDEPGNSLHSNAKKEMYTFLEDISKDFQLLFTTHYSELIDIEKHYRVLIAEKNMDNFTEVRCYAKAIPRNNDSIQPVLEAIGMGIDSSIGLITKKNVLLEECSGFYYLLAIKGILDRPYTVEYSFIPGAGANKLELIAGIISGWGLEYVIYLDNDKKGEEVEKRLHKNLLDKYVVRSIDGCNGSIEDLFSKTDFKKYILPREFHDEYKLFLASNVGKRYPQSSFLKELANTKRISKISCSISFYLNSKSESGIMLSLGTKGNFTKVFNAIESKLSQEEEF